MRIGIRVEFCGLCSSHAALAADARRKLTALAFVERLSALALALGAEFAAMNIILTFGLEREGAPSKDCVGYVVRFRTWIQRGGIISWLTVGEFETSTPHLRR